MALQIVFAVLKCYEVILHTKEEEFRAFFDSTIRYIYALTPVQSFSQLSELVDALQRLLAAHTGEVPLPVINEWSWLQPAIEENKRKSMFAPPETVGAVARHLHPYWIATLNYAETRGKIFKSGSERLAFILADATSVNTPVVGYLLANDPLLPVIEQGVRNFNLLDTHLMVSLAPVSRERANSMRTCTQLNQAQRSSK
jgi:hypothetical protein